MTKHQDTGKAGENLAAIYLEERGCRVLERNWRYRKLEIDIIVLDGDFLALVEVKTRSSARHGSVIEAVTPAKEKQMLEAAEIYLEQNRLDYEIRFDIITIVLGPGTPDIQYYPGAFSAFS